ncbi:PREDICTED: vitellogenin-1-like [Nanorana parkeri]|uniref:vitellogenin-1-like n=1 Tax=Nanorana parkeri TaxID=125878 RepID=UPI00085502B1|nr:PREDICTED: vitellogenin-1-like [Nanorana parkeri]
MWGIILALSVALAAGSQDLQYDLEFPSTKSFTYAYEGQVVTGLPEDGFAKAGLKVKCRVQISAASPRILFLKIRNLEMQEFNGIWPTDKFTSSTKLTKLLEKQLATPIKFEYSRGQVGELYIPRGLSQTILNVIRGIMNILQLTIKKTQNAYAMQENGIGGLCHTSYMIQNQPKTKHMVITKSVNLNDCEERERMVTGNAYFYPCPSCQQRNKNSRAAATYNYDVKATNTGGRLLGAEVREVHQFTPFNEINGAVLVEARQRLVLAAVQEQIHSTPENNDYITKESLRYHFERKLIQTPIQLLRTKNAENQISSLLQHLVEHNMGPLSKASPIKFLELVQHLRMASLEEIEGLWKQFSGRDHYRRWLLDAIPAIANHFSLRFLKLKLKELSEFEAAQAVPLALHLIKADREAIAEAQALLEVVNSHSSSLVRKVAYLAYGSLVHKFCSVTEYCSEEALQPLYDLLAEAKTAMNTMDIILALKGLGNSGQAACIKKILKFLPRITSTSSNLPLPVQAAAVLALKNIGIKHPAKILDICLQLYMDMQQHSVIRRIAAGIILEEKPPSSVVMMMAKSLMKEADMEVGSFVYSSMKRFSRSANPELHEMAAICNIAVAILKSRFEATRGQFSSGFYYDIYSDSLMSGMQSMLNIIHDAADVLPIAALGRLKMNFMGVFTELLEIGFHAEGLQELLMNRHLFSSGSGLHNIKKIMDMLKKLHGWKPLPSDEPLAFAHLKMFGQELFYQDLNKHSIENILKIFHSGKFASLQAAVKALQKGLDIHWSKPLLSSENRLIVPTCVGLPLETSLYYSSVTRVQVQARSHITPDPKDDLRILQLLESDISLQAKLSLSMTKEIVFMIGVNTNLIQAGMELRTQASFVLPANVETNANAGQKHFKMDFIPELPDNELISIRSKAFAVTRNSEDLAAAKMTPIVAAGTEPNVLKQTFSTQGLSAGDSTRAEGKFSAEVLSKENAYWSEQPRRHPQLSDVSMCAKAGDLGFQVCLVRNCLTTAFVRNCPLYHLIGDHSVKVVFKPVHTGASVEKIQIEFQAGPGATLKMVRSVNVRRADGGIQELENPIDRMALSKLQKILGISEVMKQAGSKNNTSSSASSSRNSSELSNVGTGSQKKQQRHKKKDHKSHHGQHNRNKVEEGHQRHQSGMKNIEHQHKHHQHSEQEIPDHISHHDSGKHKGHGVKKEMHIRCKCWPESTGHHIHSHEMGVEEHNNKHNHTKGGSDNQHKDHHSKTQHEKHHKDEHESRKNSHEHKHHEGEGEHKHHEGEVEHKHHEGEHKHHEGGEHKNHKHKQGEAKNHHKGGHKEEVQEDPHKAHHEGHHNEKQSLDTKEQKRPCRCWHEPKENGHHHKEKQKDHHHGTKCHPSQGKSGNEKKCKFLSSKSSSSSSSEDSSSSERNHEPKPTKGPRIQQKNSDSSNSRVKKLREKSKKGHRKHEKGSNHNLSHQKQHKESRKHRHDRRRHHKAKSSAFTKNILNDTRTSESQDNSWISSNFSELFEVENINSKFESTSTLTHGRRRKSSSEENSSRYTQNLSERLSPDFVFLVKALMSDAQHKGYQTTAYYEKHRAQVQTVSLDQKSSWKTCFDASASGFHKASAMIRWGKNCKDYRIAAQASTGQMSGAPAVQLTWHWKWLPSWLRAVTGSFMPYVPGVAYTLGFSELRRHNTPHQVTLRVATSTADTFDAILKTPEMTIYKQGMPFPLDLSLDTHWLQKIHLMDVTALPDVTSLVRQTVCKVDAGNIVTFDQTNLGCSLSPAPCYTVIAQDCSNQLRFLVAMKKMGQGFSTFEINVKLGSSDIKIHCDASEEFHIQLNGMWLLLKNDTYINERDCIRIHKNSTTVTVKAPKNGVEQISFNGQSIQIQISPLMRGKTCGICGNADRSQNNDWKKPNSEKAKSCDGLIHSWTVPENTCGCAMTHQYKMLEDQLIDERQSTCYSVEPTLTCREGCQPKATTPLPVAFHCLPKDSAIDLADWQANPRESSEDLIKDIDVHTSCACTEECSATQK